MKCLFFANIGSLCCLVIYLVLISSVKVYLDHRISRVLYPDSIFVLPIPYNSLCIRMQVFYFQDLFKHQVVEFLQKKKGNFATNKAAIMSCMMILKS